MIASWGSVAGASQLLRFVFCFQCVEKLCRIAQMLNLLRFADNLCKLFSARIVSGETSF